MTSTTSATPVRVLVVEGPNRIRELIDFGAQFTLEHDENGEQHDSCGQEADELLEIVLIAKLLR